MSKIKALDARLTAASEELLSIFEELKSVRKWSDERKDKFFVRGICSGLGGMNSEAVSCLSRALEDAHSTIFTMSDPYGDGFFDVRIAPENSKDPNFSLFDLIPAVSRALDDYFRDLEYDDDMRLVLMELTLFEAIHEVGIPCEEVIEAFGSSSSTGEEDSEGDKASED